MTDAFLDALANDLRPARRTVVPVRLAKAVGVGGAAALFLILLAVGPRRDLLAALGTGAFWLKVGYTGALATIGLWAVAPLARAGNSAGWRLWSLALPLAGVAAWALSELARTPPALREHAMLGRSAPLCPWAILTASVPIFGGLVWALRGLAPVRLRLTGAVAGLGSGGMGATLYAVHCPESAALFVAVWYSVGIALAGLGGALLGPRLLRW